MAEIWLNWRTWLVSALCSAGALWGAQSLYLDLTQGDMGQSNREQAGVIEYSENRVERKSSGSYLWNPVSTGSLFWSRDSIQTGVDSRVTLRMSDGSTLDILPNSVIKLEKTSEAPLNFLSGSFIYQTENETTQIDIVRDKPPAKRKFEVQLMSPKSGALQFLDSQPSIEVVFKWLEKTKSLKSRELQISRGSEFLKFEKVQIPSQAETATVRLRKGKHFWRLMEESKPVSEARLVTVMESPVLRALSPLQNQELARWDPSEPIEFRWLPLDEDFARLTHSLFVEISLEPDFKRVMRGEKVDATRGGALIRDLPDGILYWRLALEFGGSRSYSKPGSLKTVHKKKIAVAVVEPESGDVFIQPEKIHFSWINLSPVCDFQIEVERLLPNAKNELYGSWRVGKETSWVWNQPERGVYLWRVRAIHKERSVGVSDTLRFSVLDRQAIQILRPDAKARIQLSSHSALSFAWQKEVKSVTGGNRYRFVLGREAGLKTPNLNIEVKESSLEVKDFGWKQGTYFWKVELIQPNGDVVRASETQRFQVDTSPPLGAPILAIPRSGAIFNVVYHKEEPTLVWNPQEGAVDYLLEVSQSGKTVLQEKIPDIRWTLPRLKEGGYQWAVRAVDKFGRPGLQSQKRDFRIDYGPPLPAPSRVVTEVE